MTTVTTVSNPSDHWQIAAASSAKLDDSNQDDERPGTLKIESLDMEARGVAHANGKVIFVEGALLGEIVTYNTLRSKKNYEIAEALQISKPSVMRVKPRCEHFDLCGGCSMQHLEATAQVAIKQRVLEDSLAHIGKTKPETMLRPIHGPFWGYRFRGRLAVRYVAKKATVLIGFHERKSSFVADIHSCAVLPPALSALLMPLRDLINSLTIRERIPQIEFGVGISDGKLTIALVFRNLQAWRKDDEARLKVFADRFAVQIWQQPKGPESAFLFYPQGVQLTYTLPEFGVTMPFKPIDFTQVNHAINRTMISRALRLLDVQANERVLDLFCGLGNFTLPLATLAKSVVGLEGLESLTQRARDNAVHNGLANKVEFAVRNLFEITAEELARLGSFEKMLIDPPREGAQAVAKALSDLTRGGFAGLPKRLVYVSCSPSTLARDAAILVNEAGWRLRSTGIINMFPHTSHVESIAVFEPPQRQM